ncbi:MAG: hypothetical protein ACE5K4_00255 [Candidatus Hydrothermarchaeota archaeon]
MTYWICIECRHTYKAETRVEKCPECGASKDMQGKLPETTLFEMIAEWKMDEH